MPPIRVLVTGSRSWPCHSLAERLLPRLLSRYGPTLVIVHGDAPGVDTAFKEAAEDCGVDVEAHPADWQAHGKSGGPRRNAEMVSLGATIGLAVHRDLAGSRGTLDCVRRMLAAGIPVYLLDSDEAEPARIRGV